MKMERRESTVRKRMKGNGKWEEMESEGKGQKMTWGKKWERKEGEGKREGHEKKTKRCVLV